MNVALYGAPKRWAMTERGRGSLRQAESSLRIGPSSLEWDGTALTARIDEVTAPVPSRLRGVVRVRPEGVNGRGFDLDAPGRHRWRPIAPAARVEVELERPDLRWSGPGYLDTNWGSKPMERAFTTWNWSRAPLRDGGAAVLYEVVARDGDRAPSIAIRSDRFGAVEAIEPPPPAPLPPTPLWRVGRATRADAGHAPAVRQRLEDAPFYSRSVISTRLLGEDIPAAVHESLSLDRFAAPWVQAMLPFRMPRAIR